MNSFEDPNGLWKRLHFRCSEWLSGYESERQAFQSRHGYPLDLTNPRSFSEKICWRKIYDRNPLFPRIVDKYAVRKYVLERLGKDRSERILVPLLFETGNPENIPFHEFRRDYIIKANHGSGTNIIVLDRANLKRSSIIARCRDWLANPYGYYLHEWAYQKVKRRIIVEPLLDDGEGQPPREYKFQMFDGKCALIQTSHAKIWYDGSNDFGDATLPTLTYFTPDWQWLDVSWKYYWLDFEFPTEPDQEPPEDLDEMLALAEDLALPFDYMRVDLYSTSEGIKFGELTPYHLTGNAAITPTSFDYELGERWRLPERRFRWPWLW